MNTVNLIDEIPGWLVFAIAFALAWSFHGLYFVGAITRNPPKTPARLRDSIVGLAACASYCFMFGIPVVYAGEILLVAHIREIDLPTWERIGCWSLVLAAFLLLGFAPWIGFHFERPLKPDDD